MQARRRPHIILSMVLAVAFPIGLAQPTPTTAQSAGRCFEQTGFCVSGAILSYWVRNGGLPVFGYPIGPLQIETN